ncbi:MAG: rod shape-determining protein MreD [Candidatus Neomarinimicrobiota bacterium]|nr:rod shape-determining protein MreD [Candidatus Neomarinimicrobiota bacterium]|tara:strand:- start:97 stop:579 length:483 start_codon:yes stop_codon:yes gene_type:complete
MKDFKIWLLLLVVFIFQYLLSDILTIKYYRPDFIVIYILYFGLFFGPFYGVISGFCIGLLVDFTPMVSYFGISPLTYSITGFFAGHLQNKYNRLSPFVFHSIWVVLIAFHFLIFTYFKYQLLFEIDKLQFIFRWFASYIYTLFFLLIFQYFFPIKAIQNA